MNENSPSLVDPAAAIRWFSVEWAARKSIAEADRHSDCAAGAFGIVAGCAGLPSAFSLSAERPASTLKPTANGSPPASLHIDFSFVLDQLSLVMLLVVTGVGFLIHIYSVGYMHEEEGYWRYFSYLNLFMFFMTVLVLAGNALLLFVGWEGVGLASYLLIGFWFQKTSAADAGKKAFIVNRIGDFGFLIGLFLLLANFGTLTFSEIAAKLAANPSWTGGVLTAIALCLLIGATGKSAQLPLYVWLPDAMEGPTPVSALIHAATMVTAGVYMIVRMHFLFDRSPFALERGCNRWSRNRSLRSHHRAGPERHQARPRLLHHFAARLHVPWAAALRHTRRPSST